MNESFRPSCLARRRWLFATGTLASGSLMGRVVADEAPLPSPTAAFAPLLAGVYTGQVDPARCLVSEKYDGVRAVWDGQALRHRSGRAIAAPRAFVERLPATPLDGELWLDRGRFEAVSGLVRSGPGRDAAWNEVRYMVFELPGGGGTFAERAATLERVAKASRGPVVAAPQERGLDRASLQRRLDAVTRAGGEGLMLHVADAPEAGGRSDTLLKLKPFLDAEAVVVAHRPGSGKYTGAVGALDVEAADGRRFRVGSGLTDVLRRDPPAVGSTISYRYRDLTPSGLPRFATYLRRHEAV